MVKNEIRHEILKHFTKQLGRKIYITVSISHELSWIGWSSVSLGGFEGNIRLPLYIERSTGFTLPNVYHERNSNQWVFVHADRERVIKDQGLLETLRCPHCGSWRCLRTKRQDFFSQSIRMSMKENRHYIDYLCTCLSKSKVGSRFMLTDKAVEYTMYEEMIQELPVLRCPWCHSTRVEEIREDLCSFEDSCRATGRMLVETIIPDRRLSQADKRVISRVREITRDFFVIHRCRRCKAHLYYGFALYYVGVPKKSSVDITWFLE